MSYLQRVLQPGEQVRQISSLHWIIYWPGAAVGLLAQRYAAPAGNLAIYGICARARCGRSPDTAMVTVVGHRDRRHQSAGHL